MSEPGGLTHDPADEGVDDSNDGQCLQHAWHGLAVPHVHLQGGLEVGPCSRNLPAPAGPLSEVGNTIEVCSEQGGDEGNLAGPEPRPAEVVAHLSEHQGLGQGRPGLPGGPCRPGLRLQPGEAWGMDAEGEKTY